MCLRGRIGRSGFEWTHAGHIVLLPRVSVQQAFSQARDVMLLVLVERPFLMATPVDVARSVQASDQPSRSGLGE